MTFCTQSTFGSANTTYWYPRHTTSVPTTFTGKSMCSTTYIHDMHVFHDILSLSPRHVPKRIVAHDIHPRHACCPRHASTTSVCSTTCLHDQRVFHDVHPRHRSYPRHTSFVLTHHPKNDCYPRHGSTTYTESTTC